MQKSQLMGILNVTPDSFYDGGRHFNPDLAISHGLALIQEGADILDIGGESTRPYANPVSSSEEIQRVIPVIKALSQQIPLSIDTQKWEVAEAALNQGVKWINDISGFDDPKMRALAGLSTVNLCVMHMQGTPATMQKDHDYPQGIILFLKEWFARKVELLVKEGIDTSRIYLDPGIGFGKTVAHNLEILHNLPVLNTLGCHLLIGLSRKSFMMKILNKKADELLPSTIAMNTIALQKGVDVIRVHDVAEHRAVIDMMTAFRESEPRR